MSKVMLTQDKLDKIAESMQPLFQRQRAEFNQLCHEIWPDRYPRTEDKNGRT